MGFGHQVLGFGGFANRGVAYKISQSLRFAVASDTKLAHTYNADATNAAKFTFSTWVKRSNTGAPGGQAGMDDIFNTGTASSGSVEYFGFRDDTIRFGTRSEDRLLTNRLFRDPGAWMHLCLYVDSTLSTAGNRCRLDINGVEETSFATDTTITQDQAPQSLAIDGQIIAIGNSSRSTSEQLFDGYLAETVMIDGQALNSSNFGEFDDNGIWECIDVSGLTFGNNGFYLDYAVAPGTSDGAGTDASGSGNTFTETNFVAADKMVDSPSDNLTDGIGNYCTLNSISPTGAVTSDGNLVVLLRGNSGYDSIGGTQSFPRSGKWYFEVTFTTANSVNSNLIGIADGSTIKNDASGIDAGVKNRVYRSNDGQKQSNLASASSYGDAYGAGEVVGVAVDMDNGAMYFRNEGTFQNSGDPESGASKTGAAFTDLLSAGPYDWTPFIHNDGTSDNTFTANFGQFDFAATIPTGYSTLMTANYPEPAIPDGSVYFQATLYTGDGTAIGSGGQAVNQSRNSTFQPDWVWVKNRDTTDGHILVDSVRGVTNYLASDSTAVEVDNNESIVTFDSDGFTVGNMVNVNTDGERFVAWQWLADNTSGSTNEVGSITSTVATGVRAGFSIVKYTGVSGTQTVGHGLGVVPKMMWAKRLNSTNGWSVYHVSLPVTNILLLDTTAVTVNPSDADWQDTAPTSSVFSVGDAAGRTNNADDNFVCYCFAEIIGYSKFGIYTGQGSTTLNTFINTGFKPAFIILKATSRTGTWNMYDTNRGGSAATGGDGIGNITTLHLAADNPARETNDYNIDILSNGFKIYDSQHYVGENAATYIYMAWAENPFGGSGVGQARAI